MLTCLVVHLCLLGGDEVLHLRVDLGVVHRGGVRGQVLFVVPHALRLLVDGLRWVGRIGKG